MRLKTAGTPLAIVMAGALFFPMAAGAQQASLPMGFGVAPYVSLPLGQTDGLFKTGYGSDLFGDFAFTQAGITAGMVVDYNFIPTASSTATISTVGLGLRTTWAIPLGGPVAVKLLGSGGEYYVALNGGSPSESGFNPWAQGGLSFDVNFGNSFSLSTEADYRYRYGWMNDVKFSLMARFQPGGEARPVIPEYQLKPGFTPLLDNQNGLKLSSYKTDRIYPSLVKFYSDHSVAQVVLHNFASVPAEKIRLQAEMKGYTDGPLDLTVPAQLAPGEEAVVDLKALFNSQILGVYQKTDVPMQLTLSYTQNGKTSVVTGAPSLEVQPRNALSGDDDRQLASFISAEDPAVSAFGKGIHRLTQSGFNPALSPEIQTAMALSEALRLRKISISKAVSTNSVQFPQDTLMTKTGNNLDLAVLWCSLLESAGIETALVKIPGKVIPAFALAATPAVAQAWWGQPEDFLVRDGRVWVPFDPSAANGSFLAAWASGAGLVTGKGKSLGFLSVHAAWEAIPPADVPLGQAGLPDLPPASRVQNGFNASLTTYQLREMNPREATLVAERKKATDPALMNQLGNRLGIVYARYGFYKKATDVFRLAATMGFAPADTNLGNINILNGNFSGALELYRTAQKLQPKDRCALTGLILGYQAKGDQPQWNAAISLLAKVDKPQSDRLLALPAAPSVLEPYVLWDE